MLLRSSVVTVLVQFVHTYQAVFVSVRFCEDPIKVQIVDTLNMPHITANIRIDMLFAVLHVQPLFNTQSV